MNELGLAMKKRDALLSYVSTKLWKPYNKQVIGATVGSRDYIITVDFLEEESISLNKFMVENGISEANFCSSHE